MNVGLPKMLALNDIILPIKHEGVKDPAYFYDIEWEEIFSQNCEDSERINNIIKISVAKKIGDPKEDYISVTNFEKELNEKFLAFKTSSVKYTPSQNELSAISELLIDTESEEWKVVSKIEDSAEDSFHKRCVVFFKLKNNSNVVSTIKDDEIKEVLSRNKILPDKKINFGISAISRDIVSSVFSKVSNLYYSFKDNGNIIVEKKLDIQDVSLINGFHDKKRIPISTLDDVIKYTIRPTDANFNFNDFTKEFLPKISLINQYATIDPTDKFGGRILSHIARLEQKHSCTIEYNFIPKYDSYSGSISCTDENNKPCKEDSATRVYSTRSVPSEIDHKSKEFVQETQVAVFSETNHKSKGSVELTQVVEEQAIQFFMSFLSNVVDEVVEDSLERKAFKVAFYCVFNNPITEIIYYSSVYNLCYSVCTLVLTHLLHSQINNILKKYLCSKKAGYMSNLTLYFVGKTMENPEKILSIGKHSLDALNLGNKLSSQYTGKKIGKYICKKMGSKMIPASKSDSADTRKIKSFINKINTKSSFFEDFKKVLEEVIGQIEDDPDLPCFVIRTIESMCSLINPTIPTLSAFHILLERASRCDIEDWQQYKFEIVVFGDYFKPRCKISDYKLNNNLFVGVNQ